VNLSFICSVSLRASGNFEAGKMPKPRGSPGADVYRRCIYTGSRRFSTSRLAKHHAGAGPVLSQIEMRAQFSPVLPQHRFQKFAFGIAVFERIRNAVGDDSPLFGDVNLHQLGISTQTSSKKSHFLDFGRARGNNVNVE
jgi:hypothetical protein